jgi:hypothetical protein
MRCCRGRQHSRTPLSIAAAVVGAALIIGLVGCSGPSMPSSAPTRSNGNQASSNSPKGWISYKDPSGVSLSHPSKWNVLPGSEGPLVVYIDPSTGVPFRRNVNIELQRSAQPMTMSEFKTISLDQFKNVRGFSESSEGPTRLSGLGAYRIVWQGDLSGTQTLRFLSEWTVVRGQAWLVTYTSDPGRFDAALTNVERLIVSIRLPPVA